MGANFYYLGLPSTTILVARSSTTPWEEPTGPEADWKLKGIDPAAGHPVKDTWETDLIHKVRVVLRSVKVKLISAEIARMGTHHGPEFFRPVVPWIAVVVSERHKLLVESGITVGHVAG